MDQVTLSNEQKSLLAQNGFVVTAPAAGQYNEFYQLYESQRYSEQPIFATTDAVYHAYHLIFDKMLHDLERDSFSKAWIPFTSALRGDRPAVPGGQGHPAGGSCTAQCGFLRCGSQAARLTGCHPSGSAAACGCRGGLDRGARRTCSFSHLGP